MESTPNISVIIACYNVSSYISDCISSILCQTYSQLEVIAVNDGSTDGTLSQLEAFAREDSRLQLISQENQGLSAARNTGIAAASGTYLVFVDGDDWLHPDFLFRLMAISSGIDLVCCSYFRSYPGKEIPRDLCLQGLYPAHQIQRRIVGLLEEELSDPSQADSIVTAWGKLYSTSVLKNHHLQFVSTRLIGTEDALFNLQYTAVIQKVYVLNEPLYYYRKFNATSLTATYKPALFEQWKLLYSYFHDLIDGKGADFTAAYYNRICLSIIGLGLNELASTGSFYTRYSKLTSILNDPLYVTAFSKLSLRYFPLHWKLFFFFAKKRVVLPLLLLLYGIQSILKK